MLSLAFGRFGSGLSDGLTNIILMIQSALDGVLRHWQVAEALRRLIVEGLMTGVGSVVSFLPMLLILFACLSMLEDSGYMARAAFLMDRPMRALGLSGGRSSRCCWGSGAPSRRRCRRGRCGANAIGVLRC